MSALTYAGQTDQSDGAKQGAQQTEALLHMVRRVDWRFLLPTPELAQVAYIGPRQGTITTALELFATRLTLFDSLIVEARDVKYYDVVVVSKPTHSRLRLAVDLVKPNGCLYIEACSLFKPGRANTFKRGGLWHPTDYITALRRLGMKEAKAYWLWPNHEAATKIIPLHDPTALTQAFGLYRTHSNFKAQILTWGQRWFLQSGLLEYVVPYFSIIAW